MKHLLLALAFVVAIPALVQAQHVPVDTLHAYGIYDTDRLTANFHAGRRDSVLARMAEHSIALFLSAPNQKRANDVSFLYHQDPNFYYLTGHLEENSALILSKDPVRTGDGNVTHAILFTEPRDAAKETWTGIRLGIDGAKKILGFAAAMPIDSLAGTLKSLLPKSDTLYFTPYERAAPVPLLDSTIMLWDNVKEVLNRRYPNLHFSSLAPELAELRSKKTPEELLLMRHAIGISNQAHNSIMSQVRPGWHEYELQALGEYVFTKSGAEYTGYPSIVGSGENSTILHYESNRRETTYGDFIEMDMGAEYHGYSADVTRSFPVSGKFTPEQRIIYDLVLEAQDSGIQAAQVGNGFRSPHAAAVAVITRGLLKLGIIKDSADYKKYFMHGTSHYLGLDVHDAGRYGPLEAGNVITVEPGIYIKSGSDCDRKWWNIGCRIEDDILITTHGPEILSIGSPRKAEDIEHMMSTAKQ